MEHSLKFQYREIIQYIYPSWFCCQGNIFMNSKCVIFSQLTPRTAVAYTVFETSLAKHGKEVIF